MNKNISGMMLHSSCGSSQSFSLCPSRSCEGKHWDEFYSEKHAMDEGWVFTTSITFCAPGRGGV